MYRSRPWSKISAPSDHTTWFASPRFIHPAVLLIACVLALALGAGLLSAMPASGLARQETVRFAVIGDFGRAGQSERDVASLVESWNPDFIITTGDNNYPSGSQPTIDQNIGQYYHSFIYPYTGAYGQGATSNRFFPTLGNHDWLTAGAAPYLGYFELPSNERYYRFTIGPVELFAVDSDEHEPDGTSSTSAQASWLQQALSTSPACWKLVYFHHPPYSSGSVHGSNVWMQWPFQAWGADAVLAGHEHTYERIMQGGFPYFVNGLGGADRYNFGTPVQGSAVRYNADWGAMLVSVDETAITYQFITRTGTVVDRYEQSGGCLPTPTPSSTPTGTSTSTPTPSETPARFLPVRLFLPSVNYPPENPEE